MIAPARWVSLLMRTVRGMPYDATLRRRLLAEAEPRKAPE